MQKKEKSIVPSFRIIYIKHSKFKKLATLKMSVNDQIFEIDIMKLGIHQLRRYCQPQTELKFVTTCAGIWTSICWKLPELNDKYYIEFRLKHEEQKPVEVDDKKKPTDVALFWYQIWSIYGIHQTQNGNIRLFLAIHHNDFVGNGSLMQI